MHTEKDITQKVEAILNSLDGIERAAPQPFFYTRLMARMEQVNESPWNKWMQLLSKPSVAVAILSLFVLLNGMMLFSRSNQDEDNSASINDYSLVQHSNYYSNPE
jgi:hypothetical protein